MAKATPLFTYEQRPRHAWLQRLHIDRQSLPSVCDFDIVTTTSTRSGQQSVRSEVQFDFGVRGDIVNLSADVMVIDVQDFLVPAITKALGDLVLLLPQTVS